MEEIEEDGEVTVDDGDLSSLWSVVFAEAFGFLKTSVDSSTGAQGDEGVVCSEDEAMVRLEALWECANCRMFCLCLGDTDSVRLCSKDGDNFEGDIPDASDTVDNGIGFAMFSLCGLTFTKGETSLTGETTSSMGVTQGRSSMVPNPKAESSMKLHEADPLASMLGVEVSDALRGFIPTNGGEMVELYASFIVNTCLEKGVFPLDLFTALFGLDFAGGSV